MVAQDLADAAALGTSTITTATVVDVKGRGVRGSSVVKMIGCR
jgi:hypothetical protein